MCKTITDTSLWKNTLAHRENDPHSSQRERLRNTFFGFRNRVALLVNEIHRDLPDYTVHNITHLDSVWEVADIIAGGNYPLTPTEAFVYGGAVLLHDAGMALASYPNGLAALRQRKEWGDLITREIQQQDNRNPTEEELLNPPENIKEIIVAYLLRFLHAEQSETLALISWKAESDDSPRFLIEDSEIRIGFGRIIGCIAHSHWWPIKQVENEFSRTLGSPHWCPSDWTVDPLKLACLLRVADAAHIDARRAPDFLNIIRKPSHDSNKHWIFQKHLQKPLVTSDALVFTSGYAFPFREASAWWLCLDTLSAIDRELRQVDTLLAEKGVQRFEARRVAGIESPERLVAYIPTENWLPVNAVLQVSDIPKLIEKLGGEELYGKDPSVPLRELIQNASDAIRARRIIEQREKEWGDIYVRIGKDEIGYWLEVEDNGIGMSSEVLTKYLLDFGGCYWGSSLMIQDFPGLLASGYRSTGKYGIGFFSIFMIGDSIRIRTRRFDAAQRETLVLEFGGNLFERPIIRNSKPEEYLREGGTCVRIWLRVNPKEKGGLLSHRYDDEFYTIQELSRYLCPSLDVNVITEYLGHVKMVVKANDWIDCQSDSFWEKIQIYDYEIVGVSRKKIIQFSRKASKNLRFIRNDKNEIVGKACLVASQIYKNVSLKGVVSVGGLQACDLSGIAGILVGVVRKAARDSAIPVVSIKELSSWATEQANLIPNIYTDPSVQMNCAGIVMRCGGKTGPLPIAFNGKDWLKYEDIARIKNLPDEIMLIWGLNYDKLISHFSKVELLPGVLVGDYSSRPSILAIRSIREYYEWPWVNQSNPFFSPLANLVMEAAAESWGVPYENLKQINKKEVYEDRVIGIGDGREIKERVYSIRKYKGEGHEQV
jgi:hypothetical protein